MWHCTGCSHGACLSAGGPLSSRPSPAHAAPAKPHQRRLLHSLPHRCATRWWRPTLTATSGRRSRACCGVAKRWRVGGSLGVGGKGRGAALAVRACDVEPDTGVEAAFIPLLGQRPLVYRVSSACALVRLRGRRRLSDPAACAYASIDQLVSKAQGSCFSYLVTRPPDPVGDAFTYGAYVLTRSSSRIETNVKSTRHPTLGV